MKKIVLCFLAVLFLSKVVLAAEFSSSNFSDFDVNKIFEKLSVKIAITIKLDEKKVKGSLTFKEKGFEGNLTCSAKYKATINGEFNGENIAAQIFLHNIKKGKKLYKIVVKGNQNAGRWALYNGQDVVIAKGSVDDNNPEIIDMELFNKFTKTMDRVANACILN